MTAFELVCLICGDRYEQDQEQHWAEQIEDQEFQDPADDENASLTIQGPARATALIAVALFNIVRRVKDLAARALSWVAVSFLVVINRLPVRSILSEIYFIIQ